MTETHAELYNAWQKVNLSLGDKALNFSPGQTCQLCFETSQTKFNIFLNGKAELQIPKKEEPPNQEEEKLSKQEESSRSG